MIVAGETSSDKRERQTVGNRLPRSLPLGKRNFSAKKIFRTHPILAGFHRGIDGALIGAIFCAALMSALALHSQYLWTRSFARLEMTRNLNQRLEESITNLERYLLASTTFSRPMVVTKATDLLYIDSPSKRKASVNFMSNIFRQLNGLSSHPIKQGY